MNAIINFIFLCLRCFCGPTLVSFRFDYFIIVRLNFIIISTLLYFNVYYYLSICCEVSCININNLIIKANIKILKNLIILSFMLILLPILYMLLLILTLYSNQTNINTRIITINPKLTLVLLELILILA